ncbi:MAG: hypothetical protein FWG77_11025 [Treponema sp.]|nr:hypothetical protein [Treponema sp.]
MGRIKSSLEIALERTESVAGDKHSIGKFEAKQKGKKTANEFLDGNLQSLEKEIKAVSGDEQKSLKQGIFDVLISQITLPGSKDDLKRIENAVKGLLVLISDKNFASLSSQFLQVIGKYLEEAMRFEEAIKKQYAPRLRQKEEELSNRLGRPVRLEPFQDPEFAALYNQNMNALKGNYQEIVDEVRKEAIDISQAF